MNPENDPSKNTVSYRIRSIDILRGAVMVLMAIDHVRVYSGLPAGGPTPGIFFTRWVTHFCVPAFVFFAGTGAFLYGHKRNDKSKLAGFLVTRGLLLVVLELTLIRFCWTFNFNYSEFILAGVIWMLGWCMVLLTLFIWLRPLIVGIIGLVLIFFQQYLGLVPNLLPESSRASFGNVWEFIYSSGLNGPSGIEILYVLVPWIGVMCAGYGFGAVLLKKPAIVRKVCLAIGLSAIAAFIVAGSIVIASKPVQPDAPAFIYRLLNQRKYPASALYLLMTLGPAIALLPFAEKARGWLVNVLTIFGRVPLFYYILHILLIHVSALVVNFIRAGETYAASYATAPYARIAPEHQWSLPLLYLVFIIDVFLLFFACRWYGKYKFSHPENKWLKYI